MNNSEQTISQVEMETAKLLWDRWLHIEKLLVATLLAMLITMTIAAFSAATKVSVQYQGQSLLFFVGVGIAYFFLGGYYYFMLSQNYAVLVSLLQVDRKILDNLSALWNLFKPDNAAPGGFFQQILLLLAAVIPLFISLIALIGIFFILSNICVV